MWLPRGSRLTRVSDRRRSDAGQQARYGYGCQCACRYLSCVYDFIWHSLATPVLVALATTLVVEYAAKPRLEARKARIMRSRAEVDEFVYACQRLGLLAGALPASSQLRATPDLVEYAVKAVTELDAAAAEATRVLSRLSVRYAIAHGNHIAKTATFLGFLRGRCHSASADPLRTVDELKDVAGDLEKFDVYFRVHLGFGDSQEPVIKRVFWRAVTQHDYAVDADATLARHGLPVQATAE